MKNIFETKLLRFGLLSVLFLLGQQVFAAAPYQGRTNPYASSPSSSTASTSTSSSSSTEQTAFLKCFPLPSEPARMGTEYNIPCGQACRAVYPNNYRGITGIYPYYGRCSGSTPLACGCRFSK